MKERVKFVMQVQSGLFRISELCERFGISRKTGHKWLNRYRREGFKGLEERSRAPCSCPHRTPPRLRRKIIQARRKHPHWGPVTLLLWLQREEPGQKWPAASTVGEILQAEGLTRRRRRRRRVGPGQPKGDLSGALAGEVATADYKGEFRTGDGRYCYPLTVQDYASRYLIACVALASTEQEAAQRVFEQLFQHHGLPRIILTDNGTPFCTTGLGGLSRLSAWWVRLGIDHRRIEPGHPEQNPRHERMHRSLKESVCCPPRANHRAQQKAFDEFRHQFNRERPHQALSGRVPGELFAGLAGEYSGSQEAIRYPGHYEVRRVGSSGMIRFKGRQMFVTKSLAHQRVGLEEVGWRVWSLHYGPRVLARFRQEEMKLYG